MGANNGFIELDAQQPTTASAVVGVPLFTLRLRCTPPDAHGPDSGMLKIERSLPKVYIGAFPSGTQEGLLIVGLLYESSAMPCTTHRDSNALWHLHSPLSVGPSYGQEMVSQVALELRLVLERERIARLICAELNRSVDLEPTLIVVVGRIKELTGCEAVGIRLSQDGDYPFYVQDGFPQSFIDRENSLCIRGEDGQRIPSPGGRGYLLGGMCGNVIRGRHDPYFPFFTEGGSFWSNHTSALLASTTERERQGPTRDLCSAFGHESVALIPIKAQGERIGLIQLNDTRIAMFSLELIEFLEMIAEEIGLAVQNSLAHARLKEAHDEIGFLKEILRIGVSYKGIRSDEGYWQTAALYSGDPSGAGISDGASPNGGRDLQGKLDRAKVTLLHETSPVAPHPSQERA